ncbi:shikimate dehydrogenase [Microbacterium sp. 179-B 1A2 NHS]|uniref:shikimate dehydrogenase family protein n=1 Tax=Microbacterium sp. 179-B 1A2 NHS TaxID=3142383 RepID=UPI0039A21AE4
MTATALEVWGDPIDHSLSPVLHAAAYRRLGWAWTYGRRRVDEAAFADALASEGPRLRGLSLTMPLKTAAHAAAASLDARAELTGAVNTLVRAAGGWTGFNTDVGGIVAALREQGLQTASTGRIVGAGATAMSALVALSEIGIRDLQVAARRPEAVDALRRVGERLGMAVAAVPLSAARLPARDVTVATLPGGVRLPDGVADSLADGGGVLLDVVYGRGPTSLTEAWARRGAPAADGEAMLLHQAVRQIRAFATGDVTTPLPDEDDVLAVMRRALMGD